MRSRTLTKQLRRIAAAAVVLAMPVASGVRATSAAAAVTGRAARSAVTPALAGGPDGIGMYDPTHFTWKLRNQLSAGSPEATFTAGTTKAVPLVGDWNGDGQDGYGYFNTTDGSFHLRDSLSAGPSDYVFGDPGWAGMIPLVGDWNGDGRDSVGYFNPKDASFHLWNALVNPPHSDYIFNGGPTNQHIVPLAGDWDGDGKTSVGYYNPNDTSFHLWTQLADVPRSRWVFNLGAKGWKPLIGDWNGDGSDTIGVYDPAHHQFHLRNDLSAGPFDINFAFGAPGSQPLVGRWTPSPAASLDQQLATWTQGDPPVGSTSDNPLSGNATFGGSVPGLFPGSIVRGGPQYLQTGNLEPVPLQPGNGTVTVAGLPVGTVSAHVTTSTQGNVLQAVQNLTSQSPYVTNPAGVTTADFQQVTSESQAQLQASASYSYVGVGSASAFFSDANDTTHNHVMFHMRQTFFTVNYSPDYRGGSNQLSAFFAPGTTAKQAAACGCMGPGNPPAYVSSVTYGAEIFFMADSTASVSDMTAAISGAINTGVQSGHVSVNYHDKSVLDQLAIHVLMIGASANAQAPVLTDAIGDHGANIINGLQQYITQQLTPGNNASQVAVPISYSLGYLDLVSIGEYASYTINPTPPPSGLVNGLQVTFNVTGDDKRYQDPVYLTLTDAKNNVIVPQTQVANTHDGSGYWNDNTTHVVSIGFSALPAYDVAGMHLTVYSPAQSWHAEIVVNTIPAPGNPTANQVFVTKDLYFDDGSSGPCNPAGSVDNYIIELAEPGSGDGLSAICPGNNF